MQEQVIRIDSPNFSFLERHDPLLLRYAAQAERYVFDDPNTSLIKVRQFAEHLAKIAAAKANVTVFPDDSFLDIINSLYNRGLLSNDLSQVFHSIRKTGNMAVHAHQDMRSEALQMLRLSLKLGVWLHRSFGGQKNFKAAFVPPPNPLEAEQALKDELNRLRDELSQQRQATSEIEQNAEFDRLRRLEAEEASTKAYDELTTALDLAEESESKLAEEKERFDSMLQAAQTEAQQQQPEVIETAVQEAYVASESLDLDEADTRRLIDDQLREAGWIVDTRALTHKKGARPQKGRYMAISEWPTTSGPADYVLFCGLRVMGVVEAKRKRKDVIGAMEQAKRYSRDVQVLYDEQLVMPGSSEYKVPFLFSTNGRPYLKQLATKSGIWFLDGRRTTNHPRALGGWYSPKGLMGLMDQDHEIADQTLQQEPSDYLSLRSYQHDAIHAAEAAIIRGERQALLAMATGTGKTRTCIALVYRLIKAKRFRRVLFLVDRSALGEQSANAFKDVRLENLQSFTDIYDVKELGDVAIDDDTRLHIATIQSLMKRLLYPSDDTQRLSVDQYDCIIIDECHRGYTLDKEMSEHELGYRSESDYISKYRRVVDHFDAVKIGLTATPALHTTEIFGKPVYTYSYRQAVIDGWLVDHEPPVRIITALAEDGMTWEQGAPMQTYDVKTGQQDMFNVPDEVTLEIDSFNRRVVTEPFNRVVCEELVKHIDIDEAGKTLVFCATDAHADLVVGLLKEAFDAQYGGIDDDAVQKITGATDKPLSAIRRYKNETNPKIAVTVDLLSTGIDVPEIVNIVFLRRVRSRILFEQMLGRATRLCPDIDKEVFRIFDAVDIYSALEAYNSMKPVVANPNISFTQLASELARVDNDMARAEITDQFKAKLQRRIHRMADKTHRDLFVAAADMQPEDFASAVGSWNPDQLNDYLKSHPDVAEVLDRSIGGGGKLIISEHEDEVREVAHGYGESKKPEDYLESFRSYVQNNMNTIPALMVVTQRPRDLSRAELKTLKLELDKAGFTEIGLRTAWHDAKNEEIAASIIGFIRQSALGSPLLPYEQRVDRALKRILGSHAWTKAQRNWLQRIGKQMEKETIVDHEAFEHGQFKAHGGFARINKVFDGGLEQVLESLHDSLWQDAA